MENGVDLDEEAMRFEEELRRIYPQEGNGGGSRVVRMEEVEDEGP